MIKAITCADEDHHLAVAVTEGNQQALSKLYDKYAPALMGVISRIVYTDSVAEAVLQNVFLLFWKEVKLFDPSKNSVFSCLIKMARHAAIDKAKLQQLQNPNFNHPVYTPTNNSTQAIAVFAEKAVFDLVYYKGLTCTAAAAALQLTEKEIKKNIRTAIKKLNTTTVE